MPNAPELVRNAKVTNAFSEPASGIARDLQRRRNHARTPKQSKQFQVIGGEVARKAAENRKAMEKAAI